VKRCASCGREIPESASVCDGCEKWAQYHVPTAASTSVPDLPLSLPTAAPSVTPPATSVSTPSVLPSAPLAAAPRAVSAAPSPVSATPTSTPPPPATVAARKFGKRELTIAVAVIVGGGLLVFAAMAGRGTAPTTVAASSAAPVKRAPAVERPSTPVRKATQVWTTTRRGYWTANQRHAAAFELPAENTVAIWMNYVRPLLVVRCMSKKTEAFVYTGSALRIEPNTEDHTVNFRFDDDPSHPEHWPDSAEHDALFAPDPVAFAHRVMNAHTLRFGYHPHNAEPVEAVFEVSGLSELFGPSAKDCGWPK